MSRIRKASRRLYRPEAQAAAAQALITQPADYFGFAPLDWFGRDGPLELEIGAGRGDFLIEHATANPAVDFLAIELAAQVARLMAVRAGRRGLANLRVL